MLIPGIAETDNPFPIIASLGQMVTVRGDGVEYKATAAETILLQTTKKALAGDTALARAALEAFGRARQLRGSPNPGIALCIVRRIVRPGSVTTALEPLRIGRILDRRRKTARAVLEPWIVEAALARLDHKRLSQEEQRTVLEATRTPRKVTWPEWWEVEP